MANKMCDAEPRLMKWIPLTNKLDKKYQVVTWDFYMTWTALKPIPRIRLKCPVCGRKVLSSIRIAHDADAILHILPPHKVKGWWKKKKKMKRTKLQSRQV